MNTTINEFRLTDKPKADDGSKFFTFRVEPVSERALCKQKKTNSYKTFSFIKHGSKSTMGINSFKSRMLTILSEYQGQMSIIKNKVNSTVYISAGTQHSYPIASAPS